MRNLILVRRWAAAGILLGLAVSPLAAEEVLEATDVAASTAAPVEPAYVYKGDRLRDPFIPLVGAGSEGVDIPLAKTELLPFNPTGAELKGILRTPTGRWALIRTSDGATYVVQNGKIYDPKRKPISGYQGIVKEKSVFILAPGNLEFEIKRKKDEEGSPKTPS